MAGKKSQYLAFNLLSGKDNLLLNADIKSGKYFASNLVYRGPNINL